MRNYKSFIRIYSDFFTRNIFMSLFIVYLPVLFLMLGRMNIIAINNKYYNIILLNIFIVSMLFTLVKNIAEKYNDITFRNGQFILGEIIKSIEKYEDMKFESEVLTVSRNVRSHLNINKKNMGYLLNSMNIAFSNIVGISSKNIIIKVLFFERKQWWEVSYNLMDNKREFEYLIVDPDKTVVDFLNSKKEWEIITSKQSYLRNHCSRITNKTDDGSILFSYINMNKSDFNIEALLIIETLGSQICEENDFEAKQKIIKILLPPFINIIKIELLHIIWNERTKKNISEIRNS